MPLSALIVIYEGEMIIPGIPIRVSGILPVTRSGISGDASNGRRTAYFN